MQQILDQRQVEQKINRLAHQIIENTYSEDKVVIIGINGNGMTLANMLHSIIQQNSDQVLILSEIKLDKEQPLNNPIKLEIDDNQLANSCVILVDDVLNSGKTMQYALMKILEKPVRMIKTVALVDRKHHRYPIKADYVGLVLSTTLKDHVEVAFTGDSQGAYLK